LFLTPIVVGKIKKNIGHLPCNVKCKNRKKKLVFEVIFAENEQEGVWEEVDKYLQSINFFK